MKTEDVIAVALKEGALEIDGEEYIFDADQLRAFANVIYGSRSTFEARLASIEARLAAIECVHPPVWRDCSCPPARAMPCFNTACPRMARVTFTAITTGAEQPR